MLPQMTIHIKGTTGLIVAALIVSTGNELTLSLEYFRRRLLIHIATLDRPPSTVSGAMH